MNTYWNVSVYADESCKVSSGDETLELALSRAIADCVYYQTIYPNAKVSIRDVSESCNRCHNSGTVLGGRSRRIRCPECKGKLATGTLSTIRFQMPDAANRIHLVQD